MSVVYERARKKAKKELTVPFLIKSYNQIHSFLAANWQISCVT